jgi:hypothetical protein
MPWYSRPRFTFLPDITLVQEELSARGDLATQAIVVTWYVYLVAQAVITIS